MGDEEPFTIHSLMLHLNHYNHTAQHSEQQRRQLTGGNKWIELITQSRETGIHSIHVRADGWVERRMCGRLEG